MGKPEQIGWGEVLKNFTAESWNEFIYFSANLRHVCGPMALHEQADLYHHSCRHALAQSKQDLRGGWAGDAGVRHLITPAGGSPVCWVSFHLGAYRTLPLRLIAAGMSLCVLISADVWDEHQRYYHRLLRRDGPGKLRFVKAEDPHLFFELKRYIAAGFHLFVYADGTKGVNTNNFRGSGTAVTLLHAVLHVRIGFAEMAALLGLPICLAWERSTGPDELPLPEAIARYRREPHTKRQDFARDTVQDIYRHLETQLMAHPFSWEPWFYLHHQMWPRSESNWFPQERVAPFFPDGKCRVLDRYTYRQHRLAPAQYQKLLGTNANAIRGNGKFY